MLAQIVRIGNSKGLRLSSTILKKYEIMDKVEMVLTEEGILLKPVKNPREGWSESFKQMNEMGDDKLLFDDVFEDEDLEEWN
jgi:antitoxin MazE